MAVKQIIIKNKKYYIELNIFRMKPDSLADLMLELNNELSAYAEDL